MGVGGDESGICYVGPPSEAQSWQKIMEFCQIMEFCHSLGFLMIYDSNLVGIPHMDDADNVLAVAAAVAESRIKGS